MRRGARPMRATTRNTRMTRVQRISRRMTSMTTNSTSEVGVCVFDVEQEANPNLGPHEYVGGAAPTPQTSRDRSDP